MNLSGGELGDSLGSLGNSVLCKLTWKSQADSGLDLAGGDGGLLGVSAKLSGLDHDALEDVHDEGVHDRHGLLGDSALWVHLLQDLVDVGRHGFHSLLVSLLLVRGRCLSLCGFLGWCLCHCDEFDFENFAAAKQGLG